MKTKDLEIFSNHLKELLANISKTLKKAKKSAEENSTIFNDDDPSSYISLIEYQKHKTKAVVAVKKIGEEESEYYDQIKKIIDENGDKYIELLKIIGVLEGLYQDLTDGYIFSFKELIHSDIFTDFLEQAEYLLRNGYKDASAIIAGCVLEQHLRNLCIKNDIEIKKERTSKEYYRRSSELNNDLAKNAITSKNEKKQITAWLGIRNSAAHGNFEDYSENQVEYLILGIKHFISKYSA